MSTKFLPFWSRPLLRSGFPESEVLLCGLSSHSEKKYETLVSTQGVSMVHVMAWTGRSSARHGPIQAPTSCRQRRPRHLTIRVQTRDSTMTTEETARAIEVQLRRAKEGGAAAAEGYGQSQPER